MRKGWGIVQGTQMDEDGSVEFEISYHSSSCGGWPGWIVFEKAKTTSYLKNIPAMKGGLTFKKLFFDESWGGGNMCKNYKIFVHI